LNAQEGCTPVVVSLQIMPGATLRSNPKCNVHKRYLLGFCSGGAFLAECLLNLTAWSISFWVILAKGVPLGKNCLSNPLVFSFVPLW
jgi:hypothetical protein